MPRPVVRMTFPWWRASELELRLALVVTGSATKNGPGEEGGDWDEDDGEVGLAQVEEEA